MPIISAKMDSKLGFGSANAAVNQNQNQDFAETRSTISSSELLPVSYGKPLEPTAVQVARLISRTLFAITAVVVLLVLFVVLVQTRNARYCARPYTAQASRNSPFYEQLKGAESQNSGKKIPINIRMNGAAGDLMDDAAGKGHVNCVIERKTANQIIASEPKKLSTPFGNITTDPRLIHLTGEKLVFSCHSGADKENGIGEKDKDIVIISNSRETLPTGDSDDEPEEEEQQSGGNNSTDKPRSPIERIDDSKLAVLREKRSTNEAPVAGLKSFNVNKSGKDCSCSCAC